MKSNGTVFAAQLIAAVLGAAVAGAQVPPGDPVLYLSPLPGAELVSRQSTIIVRFRHGPAAIAPDPADMFVVTGERSGPHNGRAVVSDDGETVVFRPEIPLEPGEAVSVSIRYQPAPPDPAGARVDFGFTVSPRRSEPQRRPLSWFVENLGVPAREGRQLPARPDAVSEAAVEYGPPADFPPISIDRAGDTGQGYVFLTNFLWQSNPFPASYLMILKNDGTPFFFRKSPSFALDFKKQNNNLLSYFEYSDYAYVFLDSTYTRTGTCGCGDGYIVDPHDITVLDNGHILVMCQDVQTVDMSRIVPGGHPEARVTGMIYQELDPAQNVVFQWRTWDHFNITDAIGIDLTAERIDYVHSNALAPDRDGNWLVSHRHLCEITKINRTTGEIMWRLGGRNNQFRFVNDFNDSTGFYYQHDIRALDNGNYLLYDNGNLHTPPFSRAVEYRLDLDRRTATVVWQYREDPDIYGWFLGAARRLPGGNTFITWGGTYDDSAPTITEVRPDGSKVFQLSLLDSTLAYRAFRFPWSGTAPKPVLWLGDFDRRSRTLTLNFDRFGDRTVDHYVVYKGESGAGFDRWRTTRANTIEISGLESDVLYDFRVRSVDTRGVMSEYSDQAVFEYTAEVPAAAALYPNQPNPFNPGTEIRFDLPETGRVRIVVYDVAGREVETLVDETRPAGLWQVRWDGLNKNGEPAATGIYFCRMETPGSTLTTKMVKIR
jgi:hypothetical protein